MIKKKVQERLSLHRKLRDLRSSTSLQGRATFTMNPRIIILTQGLKVWQGSASQVLIKETFKEYQLIIMVSPML